ncbi:argininosuccinate lyase [Rhodococcus qingshengii]|uniref:argininosuccinate lyase n=1 Tax=Rhodococcus qingshengii TaxID=334542 RepID=UPI00237CC120|nr:argininosuccinate lyase [Rhodococcus qingshengii]WCT05870.1 argininosuccinate lyase [Rhodococcus qingshengii]
MSQKLWGGRFASDITESVLRYTETVSVDTRMLEHDLWQNIVHVLMLGEQGINDPDVTRTIIEGLLELADECADGRLELDVQFEDVHLNTEQMLISRIGADAGGRMHTARSRNDQVQTDARMVSREWLLEAVASLTDFASSLLDSPDSDLEAVIPGYTHSQGAQPISVAFWKSAHAQALLRDAHRLMAAWSRVNLSPLGSCALAGTSFPLDRGMTSELLGFDGPLVNALDATSTRDWTVEIAAAVAIAATNISRMQEEIVTWSSNEYGLVDVHDSFATGSSIMPQKKNPVVAELARGKTGRSVGALIQLLVMEKSVGLGYSCDLQEDKFVYWGALDSYLDTLRVCHEQNNTMVFNTARGLELCWTNFSTATELANLLVSEHDIPFRTAHKITGELVSDLIKEKFTLRDCEMASKLLEVRNQIVISAEALTDLFDPVNTLKSYESPGATSPTRVREQRVIGLRQVAEIRSWVEEKSNLLTEARSATAKRARGLVASASGGTFTTTPSQGES